MNQTLATLTLVDRGDQGVCPAGHDCFLNSTGGPFARITRGCVAGEYEGLPLVREDVTTLTVDEAAANGADPIIVEWARQTLADRVGDETSGDLPEPPHEAFETARLSVALDTPCASCGLPMPDEFYDVPGDGARFDGVLNNRLQPFHHGCEDF